MTSDGPPIGDADAADTEREDQAPQGQGGSPVAIVTGASRGIGRCIADALEEAGYAVERGSTGVAPVSDRVAAQAWVDDIVERHGRIDVLVNNAGIIDPEVDLFASDPTSWWETVEVNVLGAYVMTWLVAPHMRAAGGGRIINLNSGAGTRAAAVSTAYNVSKTALARVTGSTHVAGQAHGIRAFDLMPGVVRTDMTLSMRAHDGRTEWTSPQEVTELAVALAAGRLDQWSGRFVRAGLDTVQSLTARAVDGPLEPADRMLVLQPYGEADPWRSG